MDQFNERKINHRNIYCGSLDNTLLFYDGNGKTSKILFYLQLRLRFLKNI